MEQLWFKVHVAPTLLTHSLNKTTKTTNPANLSLPSSITPIELPAKCYTSSE